MVKNIFTPLLILVLIFGIGWFGNEKDYNWAVQHQENLESIGFELIHSEELGDIVNPISWFRTPRFRLYFLERDGVSTLADGILKCGLQVVETTDFENEKRFFLMINYDSKKNLVRIDEHDMMWTPIHKGEYQQPKGEIKKVVDYMVSNSN